MKLLPEHIDLPKIYPLPKHKNVPCREEECLYCKAGIPIKVVVPINDMETGQTIIHTMSKKTYNKIYGDMK